jgi:hypothetical protein
MKKLILPIVLFTGMAVHAKDKQVLSPVLSAYLKLSSELIAGNASNAAIASSELKTSLQSTDVKLLSTEEKKAFEALKQKVESDAAALAATKDLGKQRVVFASLSNNMIVLAKSAKLSDKEIYVDYCPMKKSFWLSAEKGIKNPYYGSSMLTCGSIKETIQQ